MSRHWTSSWSTIGSTQPPQDISARQTLTLFSILEPLLWNAATLEGGKYKRTPYTWPWSAPPLPPNIISLCNPWLPKNGMQGHFSIYCRLFPPGASSNSLRNLLEVSCNIFHTIIYLRNLLEYTTPVALTVGIVKPNLKEIPNEYQQFAEVFSKSKSKQLPSHRSYNLSI